MWPFSKRKRLTLDLDPHAGAAGNDPLVGNLERRDPKDPERMDHVPMVASSASAWTQPSRAARRREELNLPQPSEPPPPTLHSVLLQCDELLEERDKEIARLKTAVDERDKQVAASRAAEQHACKLVQIAKVESEVYLQDLLQLDDQLARLAAEFDMKLADFDYHRRPGQGVIDYVIHHKITKLRAALKRARAAKKPSKK